MKKLLLSLGSIAAISAPVVKVIPVPLKSINSPKETMEDKIKEDAIRFSKKGRK